QPERLPRDPPRRRRSARPDRQPDHHRAGNADEGPQEGLSCQRNPESRIRAALGLLKSRSVEAVVRVRVVVPAQSDVSAAPDLSRRTAVLWVAAATALGAAFRYYGLGWGAPYFHFHMDEHLVFTDAYLLARDTHAAAMSGKFFMYSPGPPYVLNLVVRVYEAFAHPLDLTVPRDEITYMVLGRAISAAFGTATIPLVYLVARAVSGRLAGVLAAFLLAGAVIHVRDSHFFA